MERKQMDNIIQAKIVELEDKLMDLIEISTKYENSPVPFFEFEMDKILKEIEYLEYLRI